jgi:cold shock CspA family protein
MRFEGVLSAWDPVLGCGRIRPQGGGDELFVALAAFPTDGEGARLDEALSFDVVTGRDGRKQAVHLQRLRGGLTNPALREAVGIGRARVRQAQRKRRLGLAAGGVVVLLLVLGGLKWWPQDAPPPTAATARR